MRFLPCTWRFAFVTVFAVASHVLAGDRVVPGRILLKLRPEYAREAFQEELAAVEGAEEYEIPKLSVKIVRVPEKKWARALEKWKRHPLVEFAEVDHIISPSFVPNDPNYNLQWHLPKISAPAAWDKTTGITNIIIAIIDTGVESTHPDLTNRCVAGWNFYDGNTNTSDVFGHGTAVAGTAAASSNNGQGVAGVAWNCRILPCRVTDTSGLAFESTIANALRWAADQGARVANISFRVSNSSTVTSAAQYFQSKGGVVAVSAGNDYGFDNLPDNPYVLTISATDSNDLIASWSNIGNNIDLAAPGQDIVTTYQGGWYGYWSGTSFSAPLVAGAAALVLSVNPALSGVEAAEVLKQSADDLGIPGYDTTYGAGRLNVSKAVDLALTGITNTGPTISFIANQLVDEDSSTDPISFTVGDAETAASSLLLSASCSDPSLVPTSGIVFGGSGPSRTVRIAPAADRFGTATITLTVSDGSLIASTSFDVMVNPVNDAPTVSTIPNQQVITGKKLGPISFSVADDETAAGSLILSVTSSNASLIPPTNVILAGSVNDRTIELASVPGLTGTAQIAVSVSDGELTSLIAFSVLVLSDASVPLPSTIPNGAIIRIDSVTGGFWKGSYGPEGAIIAGDSGSIPAYGSVGINGVSDLIWDANSSASSALQRVGGGRVAACWKGAAAGTSVDIQFNFADTNYHRVTFYFLDYDGLGRQEALNIYNSATGALLDSESVSSFQQGVYQTYDLKGNVTVKIRGIVGTPVLSGIFFGSLKDSKTYAPSFSPGTGAVLGSGQTVAIKSLTLGAAIRYTIDGSTPNANSTLYTGPVTLASSATIKAVAMRYGLTDSSAISGTYFVP
jgi:hypothetical protein